MRRWNRRKVGRAIIGKALKIRVKNALQLQQDFLKSGKTPAYVR
jgi:hypothetical protein